MNSPAANTQGEVRICRDHTGRHSEGLHPTDEELKAFYERNKATYNNLHPEDRQYLNTWCVDIARQKFAAANGTVADQRPAVLLRSAPRRVRVPEQVEGSATF